MANQEKKANIDPEMLRKYHWIRVVLDMSHTVVLILSLLLIVYISYDTFKGIPFMENHNYMTFQFWVCMAFLTDFFIGLFISHDKKYYLKVRWFFLFISIPYLNILNLYDFHLSKQVLFFIRFVPLLRGAYSLAMVLGYISQNRALSLMTQYTALLLVLNYCLALVFYYEEHAVNGNVHTFWDALYWAAMNTTTVGCYFAAVTPVGKVISVVLPTAGTLMLPLFTAVVTSHVQAFDSKRQRIDEMMGRIMDDATAQKLPKAKAQGQAPTPMDSDASVADSQPTPDSTDANDTP